MEWRGVGGAHGCTEPLGAAKPLEGGRGKERLKGGLDTKEVKPVNPKGNQS